MDTYNLLITALIVTLGETAVVSLTFDTFNETIASSSLVLVMFGADWCRFSKSLTPIWEKVDQHYDGNENVKLATVVCNVEAILCQLNSINKFPTIKVFVNGRQLANEYRQQRSLHAITQYVDRLLTSPVQVLSDKGELHHMLTSNTTWRRLAVGHFHGEESPEYSIFKKAAFSLRGECTFVAYFGEKSHTGNDSRVYFVGKASPLSTSRDMHEMRGSLTEEKHVMEWLVDKCTPLVQEITFDNAEELTEKNIPFLILFHSLDDVAILESYVLEVARQLNDWRDKIMCLHADGAKFGHALKSVGASAHDLPLIVIDSFAHMYKYPSIDTLQHPNSLRNFVVDLLTNKLHQRYHEQSPNAPKYPDQQAPAKKYAHTESTKSFEQPTSDETTSDIWENKLRDEQLSKSMSNVTTQPTVIRIEDGGIEEVQVFASSETSSTMSSAFAKLKPSNTRYTLLKDEL